MTKILSDQLKCPTKYLVEIKRAHNSFGVIYKSRSTNLVVAKEKIQQLYKNDQEKCVPVDQCTNAWHFVSKTN